MILLAVGIDAPLLYGTQTTPEYTQSIDLVSVIGTVTLTGATPLVVEVIAVVATVAPPK